MYTNNHKRDHVLVIFFLVSVFVTSAFAGVPGGICDTDPCASGCPADDDPCCQFGYECCGLPDCNDNGIKDECDIANWTSEDCNDNDIPDECDIADGTSEDCNDNEMPDECDIVVPEYDDCNGNEVPDECDIASGYSLDINTNGYPDECEEPDLQEIDCSNGSTADDVIVDLDIDSDNTDSWYLPDRTTYEDVIEHLQEEPGKKIAVVYDDDNNNDILDTEEGYVEGEDDLIPLVVDVQACSVSQVSVSLSYLTSGAIRIWRAREKGDDPNALVPSGGSFDHNLRYAGDVDLNGSVDLNDLSAFDTSQYSLNCSSEIPSDVCMVADLNANGILDSDDRAAIGEIISNQELRYAPAILWVENRYYGVAKMPINMTVSVGGTNYTDSVDVYLWNYADSCVYYGGLPWGYDCEGMYEFPYEEADFSMCCGVDGDFGWSNRAMEYPFHQHLWAGFGQSDFPPLSVDPQQNSLPLVSKASMYFGGPNPYPERPTIDKSLDLITGRPLIRECDFELDFGGATFRHIRTYGECASDVAESIHLRPNHPPMASGFPAGYFWDWNGVYWMMGESPLLLVDARYNNFIHPGPKRCYLLLDAHHAIPFMYDENQGDNGEYIAPPWFDAVLKHDGIQDSSDRDKWSTHPSTITVWLNRGSIRYDFDVIWQDLWVEKWGDGSVHSVHDRLPSDHSLSSQDDLRTGFPYYGLVRSISDRKGNTVEYDYCDFGRVTCTDQVFSCENDGDCNVCIQNCNEKGQVQSIRLKDAEGNVQYTLLYCYRHSEWSGSYRNERSHNYLRSIYVYEEEVPSSNACYTLDAYDFCYANSWSVFDAIDCNVPSGWVKRVLYSHLDTCDYCPSTSLCGRLSYFVCFDDWHVSLELALAEVTERDDFGNEIKKYTHYRYHRGDDSINDVRTPLLAKIYPNEVIQDLLAQNPGATIHDILEAEDDSEWNVLNDNGQTGSEVFGELAKQSFTRAIRYLDRGYLDIYLDLVSNYIEGDTCWSRLMPLGCDEYVSRNAGANNGDKAYHIYTFMVPRMQVEGQQGDDGLSCNDIYWNASQTECNTNGCGMCTSWIFSYPFHYPYRTERILPGASDNPEPLPLDERFWVAVIDERYTGDEDLDGDGEIDEYSSYDPLDQDSDGARGIISRRVVEMNPAGLILGERVWSFDDDGNPVLESSTGAIARRKYNTNGRLLEARSAGFGTLSETEALSDGLIYVFGYEDVDSNGIETGELKSIGVKKGTDGQVYYLKKYEHAFDDRPELVTREVDFAYLVTSLDDLSGTETITNYAFENGGSTPEDEEDSVSMKEVIRPSTSGTSQTAFYPVERFKYDKNGNLELYGVGGLQNTASFNSGDTFYVNYNALDDKGRPESETFDSLSVSTNYFARMVPSEYNTFLPAFDETTAHYYDELFGKIQTDYPDGRSTHYVYEILPGNAGYEQWVYQDVYLPNGVQTQFKTKSPVTHTTVRGGRVESTEKYYVETADDYPSGDEDVQTILSAQIEYDSHGRPVSLSQSDGDTASISAKVSYNGYGQIERNEAPDGTITRYTYDHLGRLRRTYRGTNDEHVYWRNAEPCGDVGPDECLASYDDNLTLIEKRYYGNGVTDAGKLITIRHLESKPINQYEFMWDDDDDDETPLIYYPAANNEDALGHIENHYYDWRMRDVWTEILDDQGHVLHNTLNWMDNLGRVVLTAEYGGSVPGAIDPTEISPSFPASETDVETVITAMYSNSPAPLSVSRNIYNKRGQVEESRTYWGAGNSYTWSKTYFDYADRPIETISPNAPVQKTVYDAKGRQVLTITGVYVGSTFYELTRTINEYEKFTDRLIVTERYERVDELSASSVQQLSDSNAIRTWAYTWYNESDKVVARAEFGTNNATFTNCSAPSPHADYCCGGDCESGDICLITTNGEGMITACGDSQEYPGARFTCYGYNEAGKQDQVFDSGGRLSYTEYDNFGHTILTVENFHELNGDPSRITAYWYDDTTGQLLNVAAVKPEHFSGAVTYDNIDWTATDGSLQITEYAYEAMVVQNSNGVLEEVTTNGSAIAAVYYPNPETGQPSEEPGVWFRYDYSGRVAERIDGRGVVLQYQYDTRGQLEDIVVDISGVPASSNGYFDVSADVSRLSYAYTASGQLETAWVTGGSNAVLNESAFTYGTLDHLASASQTLDDLSASVKSVGYQWDIPSGENSSWLGSMSYPTGTSAVLTFGHGDENHSYDCDYKLGRLTDVSLSGVVDPVASWSYLPGGRQVGHSLGNGIGFTYRGTNGLEGLDGLDGFGRVIDRDYTLNNTSVLRYEYGYTQAGNRSYMRQTGHPAGDVHSWLYEYDALDRLVGATEGTLDASGTLLSSQPQVHAWALDPLGNLSGELASQMSYACFIDRNGDGIWDQGGVPAETLLASEYHETGEDNRIGSRVHGSSSGSDTDYFAYDAAGNLVVDSDHFYRYDVFNRVTEIYDLGTVSVDTNGEIGTNGTLGSCLFAYEYDALGRRVRTVEHPGAANEKTVRHFYGSGADTLVEYEITSNGLDTPTYEETLLRYFVWGESFPDPLVLADCTSGGATEPAYYYYLKDELGSTMALADSNGAIVEGYLYSPYGETMIVSGIGGLLVESAVGNPFCYTGQRFEHQTGLYHFWARTYSTELQRWVHCDKQGLLSCMGSINLDVAFAPSLGAPMISPGSEYGDGLNLYVFAELCPSNRTDPWGLFSLGGILGTAGAQAEMMADQADVATSALFACLPFIEIYEERNLELESFSIAASDDDIDWALADYNASQLERIEELGDATKGLFAETDQAAWGMIGAVSAGALPKDFHKGTRNHCVYIGISHKTKKPAYVGRSMNIPRRKSYWKPTYRLEIVASNLTKREAQAIEQLIKQSNPHFDNKINALSKRHKWFGAAVKWARKTYKGRRNFK